MHPTLHELALAATPPRRHDIRGRPARAGYRTRRDRTLVRLGTLTLRLGHRLVRAGGRGGRHTSGAPPGPRLVV